MKQDQRMLILFHGDPKENIPGGCAFSPCSEQVPVRGLCLRTLEFEISFRNPPIKKPTFGELFYW